MSLYIVIPKTTQLGYSYNAPIMLIEANSQQEAISKSGLSRFPEWTFHVNTFHKKERIKTKMVIETNPNSKSQKGKLATGHSESRPQRRAIRRKNAKGSNQTGSHHKCNSLGKHS